MSSVPISTLVVSVALCTIAGGLLLFALLPGARRTNREALLAGIFAAMYGVRLLVKSEWASYARIDAALLPYLRALLEYTVPVAAATLFVSYFGERWRRLNQLVAILYAVAAVGSLAYEITTRRPLAMKGAINTLILLTLGAFLVNIIFPSREEATFDRRVLRSSVAIFALFVLNEHLGLLATRVSLEPFGFLLFLGGVGFVIMRRAVLDRERVTDVESELDTARKIQLSTLPRSLPSNPAIDIAVRYLPASEVAGDYYHFLDAGDDRVGIFIGDVSGHGVPAALVASMLKTAVAAHAHEGSTPAALLREINLLFCGSLERQFITAAYVCIDPRTETLRYASAGHPPPLLFRKGGSALELSAAGFVLGRFRNATFEEKSVAFGDGDRLLLYSDGLTEAVVNGEQWGEESLKETVSAMPPADAEGTARQIVRALAKATRREDRFDDDVTLIVVRSLGTTSLPETESRAMS